MSGSNLAETAPALPGIAPAPVTALPAMSSSSSSSSSSATTTTSPDVLNEEQTRKVEELKKKLLWVQVVVPYISYIF